MSKKRYEWIFENGENEIIDNITGQYVTISSPELLNEKDKKIADLEAKLAESEKNNFELVAKLNLKEHKPAFCTLAGRDCDALSQNKRVLEKLDLIVRSNQELEKENELMAKTLKMTKFVDKEVNQEKISFCIEQLEKVKGCLYKIQSPIGEKPTLMDDGDVFEVINNQIKQLKEGE